MMIKKRIPEEKVRVLLDKQIRQSNVEMKQGATIFVRVTLVIK